MDALTLHRLQFAFTITFHYLFPQLTMGLAPLIVVLETLGIRHGDERYHRPPGSGDACSVSASRSAS